MTSLMKQFIEQYGRLPTEFDKDYLEMLRMTKYKILDAPYYKPAKCANCGSTKVDGRKYVDFGLEIDWYGIIYLCSLCLGDVVKNLGVLEPLHKEIASLTKRLSIQQLESNLVIEGLKKKIQSFEEVSEHFAELRSSGNYTDSDRSGGMESTESGIEETTSGSAATSKQLTKQTTVSGSSNIPSLTKLLDTVSGE